MKRYCKNVDITDRKLIQKAVYKGLKGHFIDMMGARIYRHHITIRQRVFLRVRRTYKRAKLLIRRKKKIPLWLARKCISYKGLLDNTNSQKLKRKYKVAQTIKICKEVISHESKIRYCARCGFC